MKDTFLAILHKPKIVISVTAVVAVLIGFVGYHYVGRTPNVSLPVTSDSDFASLTSSSMQASVNSVDLAFPKTGRVGAVNVTEGAKVKKGDVLASLEATDAEGAVTQARGALELAKAQRGSLDVQYANVKKQQDVLVANAYKTLLSSGLTATAFRGPNDVNTVLVGRNQIPTISGTYSCDTEGSYFIKPYRSSAQYGFSFTFEGLERGSGDVSLYTPQPLGTCGLFILFPPGYSSDLVTWKVEIPNTISANYVANKNAYDLAVTTRDQVLKQFEANLGQNGSSAANTAQAAVDAAEGAYQAALGAYKNNLITSPIDGVVTFVDSHLKVGQSVIANKAVITVNAQ